MAESKPKPLIIKVPKTPKKAFDRNRRPSSLLLKQIEHLEWAALPASQRKPRQLPRQKPKTEGQAAERIRQLTQFVLENEAAKAAMPPGLPPAPKVVLPQMPQVKKRRAPARRRSKRKRSR